MSILGIQLSVEDALKLVRPFFTRYWNKVDAKDVTIKPIQ